MFLKRRKMWIWMCCILSAFLISMGLSLTGEKEDDNVYETAVYAVETTEMAEVVEIESYMNDVEEHETSTGYGSAKFNKSKIPHIVGPVLVIVGVIFAIPFIFMMTGAARFGTGYRDFPSAFWHISTFWRYGL